MSNLPIALLGATSHIAKGLIENFVLNNQDMEMHLYARDKTSVERFLKENYSIASVNCEIKNSFENLQSSQYKAIINCVGVGTVDKFSDGYFRYFTVTEKFDNLVLDYIKHNPDVLYINISSGIVYGDSDDIGYQNGQSLVAVNNMDVKEYCIISNMNAEAKHRAYSSLRIVDLRVFSYFSRFADLTEPYFINKIVSSVLKRVPFVTSQQDMVRDYIDPKDLYQAVCLCMKQDKVNAAYDVFSMSPASKKDIIDQFINKYGLIVEYVEGPNLSGTGEKNQYFSYNYSLHDIGFDPNYSAIDAVLNESARIINMS